jgi:hypothetical protein
VHATLAVDVPTDHEIFSASNSSFGYGIKKLHKKIQDAIRDLDYRAQKELAYELPRDDQRALSVLATHGNLFANAFPLALPHPDARFSNAEFTTAICRKLGVAIPRLLAYVGKMIGLKGIREESLVTNMVKLRCRPRA